MIHVLHVETLLLVIRTQLLLHGKDVKEVRAGLIVAALTAVQEQLLQRLRAVCCDLLGAVVYDTGLSAKCYSFGDRGPILALQRLRYH